MPVNQMKLSDLFSQLNSKGRKTKEKRGENGISLM